MRAPNRSTQRTHDVAGRRLPGRSAALPRPACPARSLFFAGWIVAWGLAITLNLSSGGIASAQNNQEFDVELSGDVDNKFLPAPRSLLQQLTRARQAIAAQQYNVAVEQLGAILAPERAAFLDRDVDQDYFIAPRQTGGAMPSLKTEAQRLIGSMPTAGRELYELRYGAAARAQLEEAVRAGDLSSLTEVTRKYFHTRAGYESTLLLGRRHLDEGRPLAAAFCFQRLHDVEPARRLFEPELSILLATCWLYAGSEEQAEETLRDLKRRLPDAKLRIGREEVRLFRDDRESVAWLEQVLGHYGTWQLGDQDQWVVFRGDPGRNARTSGGDPLTQYRWRVPTTNDPTDEQLVQDYARQNTASGPVLLPSLQPLAVRDVVLMRTPRRLFAVDFETGKRIWEFPWDDTPDEMAQRSLDLQTSRSNPSPRMTELSERLWQDAAYGQVSSDGESVFLLSELSFASTSGVQNFIRPGGFQQLHPNWPKSYNKLVSLSLGRQGALQWVVGGEDGADEPRLAGAFFLGVPLPVMGQLYVLAELSGEIRLIVLDAKTGVLQWQQQLAHVDAFTIQSDVPRRLAAASPSFADGILVCPTSAGAVVAIDISSRTLLWGFQYPVPLPSHNLQRLPFNRRSGIHNPQEETWADATATIHDGRVLLTPIESGELFGLDLLTGRPLWNPRPREEGLFLGCVHNNLAIIIGKSSVQAIDVRTGEAGWEAEISLDQARPSGRGFYSENYYYLPTTQSELLQIDLESGEIVQRRETRINLGNLICYRDQIISQGVDWLTAFYQSEPLRDQVVARLAEDPQDRWALARQCELLLQDGKKREALEAMWTSYELDPEDDVLRNLLVETYLEALGDDFATHSDRLADLEPLIDQPAQRAAYLRLLSLGLQQQGDLAGAFEAVLKLADETGRTGLDPLAAAPGNGSLERIDRRWSVRRDRWIQSRVASLLRAASDEPSEDHLQGWDEQIRARYEVARERGNRGELRRFIEQFSPHPQANEGRLRYARLLIDDREWLAAELQLAQLAEQPESPWAMEASMMMAELLAQSRRDDEAARYIQQVLDRWPDALLPESYQDAENLEHAEQEETQPSSPRTVAQWYAEQSWLESVRSSLERPEEWPYGRVDVETLDSTRTGTTPLQRPALISLRDTIGPWPTGTSLVLDTRSNVIHVQDAHGRTTQQVPLSPQRSQSFSAINNAAQAKAHGHLAVVSLPNEVLAIDLLRLPEETHESVLWRLDSSENITSSSSRGVNSKMLRHPWSHAGVRAVPSDGTQARVPLGYVGPVTRHGVCFQRFRELVCVDPMTGDTVWSREGIELGADLFGDDELLFVVPFDHEEAMVLDASTGQLLDTRPIEKLEQRWATRGRRVLAWREAGDQLVLKLYDAWSQEVLWEEHFGRASRGELMGEDELAILSANGELVVLSLNEGQERFRQQLRPVPNFTYLHVLPSSRQYLVLAAQTVNAPPRITLLAPNQCSQVLQGQLYALDRKTGEFQWPRPAEIEQFAVPLNQPPEAPVFVFLRNITYRMNQNRQVGSILCIDKRDGRLLHLNDELTRPTSTFQIFADPDEQTVQVHLAGPQTVHHAIQLRLTDEPAPPAPPARTGDSSSSPNPFTANRIRQWAGMLVAAFEQGEFPAPRPRRADAFDLTPFAVDPFNDP